MWDAATLVQRASYQQQGEILAATVRGPAPCSRSAPGRGSSCCCAATGPRSRRAWAHDDAIFGLAISSDETVVATASSDRTARLWSAAGEPRGSLAGHRADVTGVRFTSAGDRLVTTSADNAARLWSTSAMLLGELTGHRNIIMMAAVRSDGTRLATASWDHTTMVWDLARTQELRPILAARDGSRPTVAFDPDGRRLALARADGTLSVVDVQTGTVACTAASAAAIRRLVWTGSDEIAAGDDGARAIELWDARRCAVASTLEHPAPITGMSTRSGPRLVTAADDVVRVWSRGRLEASLDGYTGRVDLVGVDGDDVYATTNDPVTIVVDAIGGPARRRIFRAGNQIIIDVQFDHARGQVIAASLDQSVYIWDEATGALVRKLEGSGPLWRVRTSPDGSIMVGVGGVSPTVWDRTTGAPIRQLEGHPDLVTDGEFIDDQIFVSVAWNHTAFVWDIATARPLMKLHDVEAVEFAPDRRSVALIGPTGVRVWSPRAPTPDHDALRALHVK